MIDGKRVLAIAPARGGSKGVPMKNLRPVLGVPIVAMVGDIVKKVSLIDRAVVSTDHPEIARVAQDAGLSFIGMRPPELSADMVADHPVLLHELMQAERVDGVEYDIIVMLQPTSPMRKPEHVEATIRKLVEGNFDSVWTVSRSDSKYHPLKQLKLAGDRLEYYDSRGSGIIARQQLDQLYHRNGAAYAMTRECIVGQGTIKGKRAGAVLTEDEMISVDTLRDFMLVEFLLRTRET